MNYKIVNESTLIDTLERHLNGHLLDDVLERLSDEISSGYEQMIIVHVRKDDGGEMVANLYFYFRVMEEYVMKVRMVRFLWNLLCMTHMLLEKIMKQPT